MNSNNNDEEMFSHDTDFDAANKSNNWHSWCRLCAKDSPDNVKVYTKNDSQVWNSVIATSIGRYFWVNIKMEDELSDVLCTECLLLIESLNSFTDRIQRVQTMMSALQKAEPGDLSDVRNKYGLLDEDWQHFMKPLATTNYECADEDVDNTVLVYTNNEQELQEPEGEEEAFGKDEIEVVEYLAGECEIESAKTSQDQSDDQHSLLEVAQWKQKFGNENEGDIQKWDELTLETIDSDYFVTREDNKSSDEKSLPASSTILDDEHEDVLKDIEANDISLQNIYSCPICKKNFNTFELYRAHMRESHNLDACDLPDLECRRCNATFTTENELLCHYRSHMTNRSKQPTSCTMCDKKFPTPASMKKHYDRVHENIKLFVCDCCGKALKTLGALNEHKLVHTDECPFECPICKRGFKNKARLKIHSETHGSNSYICNICGLKLNTRRTFNTHKLVHSELKQYQCTVCEAAFKRSKSLKSHLILHTGLRPYTCNFCNKTFSNGPNCRAHKRKIHSEELAAEESQGLKKQTKMPLLSELQVVAKECVKPRKITRSKCLPDKMRALLKAAEQREKEQQQEEEEIDNNLIEMELNDEDGNCFEIAIENDVEHEPEEEESDEIICEIVDEI